MESLREQQKDSMKNLVGGKDVFGNVPTGFAKRLLLITNGISDKSGTVSKIIVITLLIAIMKDQGP